MGILIKLIPLLKILETKPATSPVIPPPTAIIRSDRLKLLLIIIYSNNNLLIFKDLFFSLALKDKNKRL